jgi:hypothetical protein
LPADVVTTPQDPQNATARRQKRLGIGAAIALVVLEIWMIVALREGTIVVNVNDPTGAPAGRVDVVVDGKKISCQIAPCTLRESTGWHEVEVSCRGNAPAVQAVLIESRRTTVANFVVDSSIGPWL